MKTIGVLGGLGPQATTDFIERIHKLSQKLLPQRINTGYPPILSYYYREAPVLLDENSRPRIPLEANPTLFDAARKLRGLVDFLVIPSNTPHLFADRIEEAAGCELVSIIETALAEVARRRIARVGVVGLGEPTVYTKPLGEQGVQCETLSTDPDLRAQLDSAIIGLMEGKTNPEGHGLALKAIDTLRAKNVEGVILGCTEIPLLLGPHADAPDLLHTSQLLAEAAVRRAID